MEVVIATISVLGLSVALCFNIYLSYKERKEIAILNKSKDVSEFEYIVSDTKEEDEKPEELLEIEQMPDLKEGE